MKYETILYDINDGIARITINQAEEMNKLSTTVLKEVVHAARSADKDKNAKVLIISGAGEKAFCAGADIGKFPSMLGDPEASAQYARDCANVQIFIDQMEKPVVAAVNGLALGGGLEVAIRCHSMVALENATLQFPEISLGILPGIGGCVVPYRRWPQGAAVFHEMICLAKPLKAKDAAEIGMVTRLAKDYPDLIRTAIEEVERLQGNIPRIAEGKIEIPDLSVPDEPRAGGLKLSPEAVSIAAKTIQQAAGSENLTQALEIGYRGFGEIACTDAAKEGISAFLERRKPEFKK